KEKSEIEKLIPTKKGLCYFQVKMKKMLDVSGKFFGTVVILNDLTELKNTSESLKQSEERYRNIVKDQTEFITRFTPDGTHTFVNDAYCNYMKMRREELIGKSFFSFLPEEDYKKLKSLLESLTLTNPIKEIEHRYIIGEKTRFLHWINRAIFDDDGNLIEYQAVGRDITDKKKIEDELRKKKEELSSIFENSSVGIDLVDSKGNFLEVNSKLAELLGHTAGELLKLNINDVTHPEDLELSKNELIPLFNNKMSSYNIEKRYLRKDGSYFWADLSVTPIKDDLGQIVAVTGVIQDITERKMSEERLKSKNKELENIIEFLPDATFIIDKDDKIIAWNHAIEEMTGIPKKDMIGKEHIYVSIPFYGKSRRQLIDILFDKNSDIVSKYKFIKTKGDMVYAEVFTPALYNNKGAYVWAIAAPLYDNEGNKVGAIESIRDVTYQKRAEEELLKEKEFVNTLVQASPAFYVAITSKGKVLLMNNSMLTSLGYELAEVMGADYISTFVPKEEREYLAQTFDNLIKSKVPTINENNILTKDGKKILVEWHGRSILKEDGTFDFFFGVGLDITEKDKFQKALKESEEKYRELVENANSIILKFDNEGRILSMNEFGLKFFGYSENEIIGELGIGTIVPEIESSGKELKKLIKDMINFESDYNININENVKKSGERVWIYWTNKLIRDENGIIKGIFCVGTDITERKKAEDKVNELNETLRILNKILRHDILNDLTIVLTVCDLMGDSNPRLKQKASRALDKSITLIERMRELEQALISDSPIQKYEIDQVILDIIKNYPEIKFNVSGKCKICTDEAIFSVIDNIIRNAIIHGKTKRIDIEIRETEKYCIVKIADYGIGVPEEIKTRIFEEGFSYGDNRSTGLGLYIVKKIMERYGGSIKVSDNKPTGAIFILEYTVCSSKNRIC
ncbi:MAG TPA: PAS domain S-box protein, partial [Methanofastidiosum sp.]|nr:PAS domain S-box protein [Methanofastidiosum sp.]